MQKRPVKPAQMKLPGAPAQSGSAAPVKPAHRHAAVRIKTTGLGPGGMKIPGVPIAGSAAPVKPARKAAAARKKRVKRKLAAPGENCVLDACYALAGFRPNLDYEDGLFIPDALEALAALGLIAGFAPADVEGQAIHTDPQSAVMARPALILGVDLPGPHAVLTTADGWWSWGELYDPGQFPHAVIEEAWQVTWPS